MMSDIEVDVPETTVTKKDKDSEGRKIINNYKIIKELGQGAYSKVYLATNLQNNLFYAVKKINKKELAKKRKGFTTDANGNLVVNNLLQDAMKEIAILKKLRHKNIIKLQEIMTDEEKCKTYIIMEFAGKGPIMHFDEETGAFSINEHYIDTAKKDPENFTEDEVKDLIRDLLSGLHYLHTQGIAHRDIKPDNIILDDFKRAKISDFNVSAVMMGGNDLFSNVEGTTYFFAPECCKEVEDDSKVGYHGKPADIWALGVTTFILVFKKLPFSDDPDNVLGLYDTIAKGEFEFPKEREISDGLKQFICKMLEKDPEKRPTAEELKKDAWLNQDRPDLCLEVVEKIKVTDEEVKRSLGFFQTIRVLDNVKKFANKLKKKGSKDSIGSVGNK